MTGGSQSALDPAGPFAGHILELFWLFTIVCAVVWLAVVAVLLAAIGRRRWAGDELPDPRLAREAERRLGRVVGAAVVLTVVILFGFLIASYLTDRQLLAGQQGETRTIHLTAHQWWWEISYEDGNPSRRVTTANELHLPAGEKIHIRLSSTDVIHSFWVPNLHGKQDLIPGVENHIYLQADEPGVWRGQCAEFCGFQHAHMALHVVVEDKDAFERWKAAQLQPAPEPAGDLETRGRDVFLSGPCVMCHRISGTEAAATAGPDLTHLKSRGTIAAGTLPNTREHLAAWITDPQAIKPGNRMPLTQLEPGDLEALRGMCNK